MAPGHQAATPNTRRQPNARADDRRAGQRQRENSRQPSRKAGTSRKQALRK
jgi:hypothetical protein